MRRFTYGQNFTTMNTGTFNLMTFLGTLEVAPGDSVSGSTNVHSWSDTTYRPIQNRAYNDTYAFYVPFRLLWEDWTDFIVDTESGLSPPEIQTAQKLDDLMERPTLPTGNCLAWNRRAYNLIYNRFFKLPWDDDVALDDPFLKVTPIRESTFHESMMPPNTVAETTFSFDVTVDPETGVGTGDFNIDNLRGTFAKDRFDKIRSYYGSKYVDYLAALGVKTSWAVAEEPEPIGRANKDFRYHTVDATLTEPGDPTPEQNLADPAGYFETRYNMRLRNTFAPEHGIIVFIGASRMDIPCASGQGCPTLAKDRQDYYWTPERETQKLQGWYGNMFGPSSGSGYAQQWEDYRKPAHQIGKGANTTYDSLYYASYANANQDVENYRKLPLTAVDDLFTGRLGGVQNAQFCQYLTHRLRKKSPVKPPAQIRGVS